MKCLSNELLTLVKDLNVKCLQKLEESDEESKNSYRNEYIVMRNYIQKKEYYVKDLVKATNLPEMSVRQMLKNLGFVQYKNRRIFVKRNYLNWVRRFVNDFRVFFNFPNNRNLNRSITAVNSFMKKRTHFKNYKIILLNVLETEESLLFPEKLVNDMKVILKNASWGVSKYYFKELYEIYLKTYPELNKVGGISDDLEFSEPDDSDAEESLEGDAGPLEGESTINLKDILEQNQRLNDELNESRAVSDFLSMQYDDLKITTETQKQSLRDKNFSTVFRAFNAIENNNILDAFFIAKSTLDELKTSGWKPSPPELKSILYIFDLFANFFNKQQLTSKFKLGEIVKVTLETTTDIEYKGQELKAGMEVFARVKSPAWYYKNILISKANVLEIQDGGNK